MGDKAHMNVSKTLVWVSRVLFIVGGLLFASLFIFIAVRSSSTGVDANGAKVNPVSAGDIGVLVLVFSSVAWCWLAGSAARTLATAPNWGRALPEIASLAGFALFFAMPTLLVSGASGEGHSHTFAAVLCAIFGFLIIVAAKIVAFAMFGAKDMVAKAEIGIAQVTSTIASVRAAEQRNRTLSPPGTVTPAVTVFTPQPPEARPERP